MQVMDKLKNLYRSTPVQPQKSPRFTPAICDTPSPRHVPGPEENGTSPPGSMGLSQGNVGFISFELSSKEMSLMREARHEIIFYVM